MDEDSIEGPARDHGFSAEAVSTLAEALRRGSGRMAQFDHPELGGMGQWSSGGMIMISDMGNSRLKARVDALCGALAGHIEREPQAAPSTSRSSGTWWPPGLGEPAATGAQNDWRYAYFPSSRRLALQVEGRTRIYDTGEHRIHGVSQQQGGIASISFSSQRGTVRVEDLREVDGPA